MEPIAQTPISPPAGGPSLPVQPVRGRQLGALALLVFAALVTGVGAYFLTDNDYRRVAGESAALSGGKLLQKLGEEFFLNPWFYVIFATVLLLERLIPAREQPALSRGLRTDLWWIPVKL